MIRHQRTSNKTAKTSNRNVKSLAHQGVHQLSSRRSAAGDEGEPQRPEEGNELGPEEDDELEHGEVDMSMSELSPVAKIPDDEGGGKCGKGSMSSNGKSCKAAMSSNAKSGKAAMGSKAKGNCGISIG